MWKKKQVDPATLKLRNEARVAIDACEELAGKEGLADQRRKTPWSASVLREAVTGGDDGWSRRLPPAPREAGGALGRALEWGLLCDALPVLVERRWSLTDAAQEYDEVPGPPLLREPTRLMYR